MNTKTTKLLAVLAVFTFAFVALAAEFSADESEAADADADVVTIPMEAVIHDVAGVVDDKDIWTEYNVDFSGLNITVTTKGLKAHMCDEEFWLGYWTGLGFTFEIAGGSSITIDGVKWYSSPVPFDVDHANWSDRQALAEWTIGETTYKGFTDYTALSKETYYALQWMSGDTVVATTGVYDVKYDTGYFNDPFDVSSYDGKNYTGIKGNFPKGIKLTVPGNNTNVDISLMEVTGTITTTKTADNKTEKWVVEAAGFNGSVNPATWDLTTFTGGSLTLTSGDFEKDVSAINCNLTIAANATLELTSESGTTITGDLTVKGTLILDENLILNGNGKLWGTIKAADLQNIVEITVNVPEGKEKVEFTAYTGSKLASVEVERGIGNVDIDLSGATADAYISGEISTKGTIYSALQNVTFGDCVVLGTADVTFKGTVTIPEGVTVEVEDGAFFKIMGQYGRLFVYGTLIIKGAEINTAGLQIEGGKVENNGIMTLDYAGTAGNHAPLVDVKADSTFVNKGLITISEDSCLKSAVNIENAADGIIVINGEMEFAITEEGQTPITIINSGVITIDSEVVSDPEEGYSHEIAIKNAAAGAKVEIVWTTVKITVDDDKFTSEKNKIVSGHNSIVITPGENVAKYGGITIVSMTYKVDDTKKMTAFSINGDLEVKSKTPATAVGNVAITLSGDQGYCGFTVDVALYLSNVVPLTITGTELYVSGLMAVDSTCDVQNSGEITVVGSLLSQVGITTGTVNAAGYEIPKDTAQGTPRIYVYTNFPDAVEGAVHAGVDTVNVTGEVDVYENVVIPVGMAVKVKDNNATLTIEKDIVVEVEFDETVKTILDNSGTIEVYGKLVYDNAKKSMKGAEPVSDVKMTLGDTAVYTTLAWAIADVGTEEAVVTLNNATTIEDDITIPENVTVDTNDNDLTVSAKLTIDGILLINGGEYKVGDEKKANVVVNGAIMNELPMDYYEGKYPAGLYLYIDATGTYVIGSIDDAEEWALVADDDYGLKYFGDLKTAAISFDSEATLVFNGEVAAQTMNVGSGAKVTFMDDVAIDHVTVGEAVLIFEEDAIINGEFESSVGVIGFDNAFVNDTSAIIVAVTDAGTRMGLAGDISYSGEEEEPVVTSGDITIGANLSGLFVESGTVTIARNINIDEIAVGGDLVFGGKYTLTSKLMRVYGSVTVPEGAQVDVRALLVGIYLKYDISATAEVTGNVTAYVALVATGATVPESISGMNYHTDVYVEGAVYMTAYTDYKHVEFLEDLDYVVIECSDPNALGPYWYDEDGTPLETADIGEYEAIYGFFNYNVYELKIVTDAGVKSVAINGTELINAAHESNVFELPEDVRIPTGTYKVTYTLKSGYQGNAVLSTYTGTILKDNTFVISPGGDLLNVFQLTGTEQIPEPDPVTPEEQSEWTVTAILLAVLVALIAIIAVIIALRLNRS